MKEYKKILVRPNVKTIFLKNSISEKVTYLELPWDYDYYSIEEDRKKGAVQFTETERLMNKKKMSRVVAVTADTMELGLMAVTYLAMNEQKKRSMRDELPFDTCLDEMAHSWYESGERIPVLSVAELARQLRKEELPFDNGGFLLGQAKAKERHEPFWKNCNEEAVCLIVSRTSVTEDNLDIISLFSTNRQVYVVFLENPEKEDALDELPFGVLDRTRFRALCNNFILSYAADAVNVSFGDAVTTPYYKNILKQNLKQRGIKVKRGFSYERVVNLAGSVNRRAICEMMDKTIDYAIKDMSEEEECVLGNEDFAFIDHFLREKTGKSSDKSARCLLEENLVGMEAVKQQVYDVVNVMKYNKLRKQRNISGSQYHNVHVMLGAPGTAKTTVAKYMGQLMFDEKLLSDTRFICVNGAELKGMYVGHSAPKTKALFEKYDVIIIDEAYSIVEAGGGVDSFANEAIAQLIIELERHSTDKLIIFAGYGGEDVEERDNKMKNFLEANPGIKSRITSTFYFQSYSAEEMADIFLRIAKISNYEVQDGVREIVREFFAGRVEDRDFGNGREARALLENATLFAARRLMQDDRQNFTDAELCLLTVEDVCAAIEKMREGFSSSSNSRQGRIGFVG